MARSINLEGLSEEQVRFIEAFVAFLRQYNRIQRADQNQEEVTFATHRSGVKGRLTREEIYDYL